MTGCACGQRVGHMRVCPQQLWYLVMSSPKIRTSWYQHDREASSARVAGSRSGVNRWSDFQYDLNTVTGCYKANWFGAYRLPRDSVSPAYELSDRPEPVEPPLRSTSRARRPYKQKSRDNVRGPRALKRNVGKGDEKQTRRHCTLCRKEDHYANNCREAYEQGRHGWLW